MIMMLRRFREYQTVVSVFLAAPADQRADAIRARLNRNESSGPIWYLLGCLSLRNNQVKDAARAFGMAHHNDYRLETAALLTFACLKSKEGGGSDIIEQMLITWEEMNRPDFLRNREDRWMLNCLALTTRDAPKLSPLGCLIWSVTGPVQQSRIEELISTNDPRGALLKNDG